MILCLLFVYLFIIYLFLDWIVQLRISDKGISLVFYLFALSAAKVSTGCCFHHSSHMQPTASPDVLLLAATYLWYSGVAFSSYYVFIGLLQFKQSQIHELVFSLATPHTHTLHSLMRLARPPPSQLKRAFKLTSR